MVCAFKILIIMSVGKLFLIVFGIVFGVAFTLFLGVCLVLSSLDTMENKTTRKLLFKETNKVLYVETAYWGLAGNHNEISISEISFDEKKVPDKQTDYIFYTSEIFYNKDEKNTIYIFAPQSGKNIPEIPFKNIEVVFKGLKTADEIKDYDKNYAKYGLEKISIYNE